MRNLLKNTEPIKKQKSKLGKNIKVGKNQIFRDWDGMWVVEVFEYMQNGVPMYSVLNSYKDKKIAMKVARVVNRYNTNKILDMYGR